MTTTDEKTLVIATLSNGINVQWIHPDLHSPEEFERWARKKLDDSTSLTVTTTANELAIFRVSSIVSLHSAQVAVDENGDMSPVVGGAEE